ncbi:hypothetical protein AZH53_02395 [Methanomicrobiaceae archaeon CYW5]|uniref:hypothetical protein n=1 Tax=Methanovulcanius yangii TaxID=1789227 RepID=UPI0029CA392D|nr:hypothetical protein [Methanovulcanius yangii]MBT8507279.1 hypothetical protein [Methanovulcanius yangii]
MDVEEQFDIYISRISEDIHLNEDTAHWIALMLIAFRMDLFDRTISMADKSQRALGKVADIPVQVAKAIAIIREEAIQKVSSQKTIRSSFDWDGQDSSRDEFVAREYESVTSSFEPPERDLLIVPLSDEEIPAPDAYMRDNALILLYGVARAGSPLDAQALEEHLRDYLVQRLELYDNE